jgi:hypothetical protein
MFTEFAFRELSSSWMLIVVMFDLAWTIKAEGYNSSPKLVVAPLETGPECGAASILTPQSV